MAYIHKQTKNTNRAHTYTQYIHWGLYIFVLVHIALLVYLYVPIYPICKRYFLCYRKWQKTANTCGDEWLNGFYNKLKLVDRKSALFKLFAIESWPNTSPCTFQFLVLYLRKMVDTPKNKARVKDCVAVDSFYTNLSYKIE